MKRNILIWIGCIVLMMAFSSCVTQDKKTKEKEANAYRRVGEAYLHQGNFPAALKEFKKAEAKNPKDHILQYDLGLVYFRLGKFDEAIKCYNKALELSPNYGPAINSLGNAYAGKEDWDQAIFYYKKVTKDVLYATPHIAYSNLGNAYYYKGDLERSEQYYLEALDSKPDFITALSGLSRTYIAMGRIPEAVGKLEKAVRIAPEAAVLHFQLGRAYQLALEFEKAYRSYQQVVRLAPDSSLADQAEKAGREVKALF
ncbi:MAG: tetratricopeptide repeat protein [Deltaproteobacteria bacterium]|jgi:tetratricopeptide (TPR) repeat protein|nr:tetratricopeptide repeat protein [Deltaproteobacteria bacterium]